MGLPPNLAFQDLVLCLQGLSSNIQISIFNLLDCKMNIDSYCRLCALPKPQLVRIFDEEGHRCNIVANINKCLKIEVTFSTAHYLLFYAAHFHKAFNVQQPYI